MTTSEQDTMRVAMDAYARLLELDLGLAQPDSARVFDLLAPLCPFETMTFASGLEHNGWVVPQAWRVKRASITRRGRTMFDGTSHPMAVAAHSHSFHGTVLKGDLDRHVFFNRNLPHEYAYHSAWGYRPAETHWGFCVPFAEYATWEDGAYEVDLDVEFSPGAMVVGHCEHLGRLDDTIVFNAHNCHRGQANDDLSGVIAIVLLFNWLRQRQTRYSYRAVVAPEHLGTVFYLANRPASDIARLKLGCFVEMVGSNTSLALQRSFTGRAIIDKVAEHVLTRLDPAVRVGAFRTIIGNDETVWESPGIEVPTVSISRFPYPEYHTSADTLSIISADRLRESVDVLRAIVEILESDCTATRRFTGLVALSNPKYGLYIDRWDPSVEKELTDEDLRLGALQDRLLRYFDGRHSVFDIARSSGVSFLRLRQYIAQFEAKSLVDVHPIEGIGSYATLTACDDLHA